MIITGFNNNQLPLYFSTGLEIGAHSNYAQELCMLIFKASLLSIYWKKLFYTVIKFLMSSLVL